MLVVSCWNVVTRINQTWLWLNCIQVFLVDISIGKQHHSKSWEMCIIGPLYLLMYFLRSEHVSNVKCFLENKNIPSLPLNRIIANGHFQQWGLEFIGEIHPPSSGQHKWILPTTDYFTKWIESIPTSNAIDKVIMNFLEEYIFSRFGCPRKLIIDNAKEFNYASMV